MANKTMSTHMRQINGTFDANAVEVPLAGEIVWLTDTTTMKVGDGVKTVSALPSVGGGNYLPLTGGKITGALQVTGDIGVGPSNRVIISDAVDGVSGMGGVLFNGQGFYIGNMVSTMNVIYSDERNGITLNEPDVDMILNENTGVFKNFVGRCRKAGSTFHFEYQVTTAASISAETDPLVASFGSMQQPMIPNQAAGMWYNLNSSGTALAQSGMVYWNTTGLRPIGIYLSVFNGTIAPNRTIYISMMWNMISLM